MRRKNGSSTKHQIWAARAAMIIAASTVAMCGDDESSDPAGNQNNAPANDNNSAANNNTASNNNGSANNNSMGYNSSTANNNNDATAGAWPIERVTVGRSGVESDANTNAIALSQTGRYAAFESQATTISTVVPMGTRGIFVRDRVADTTVLINLNNDGAVMGATAFAPDISDDGTKVIFESTYQLFDGDISGRRGTFVRDLTTDTTTIASLTDTGARLNGDVQDAAISGDGRSVAFASSAINLSVVNGSRQLFVRDLLDGTTDHVSRSDGTPANRAALDPDINDDGTRIAFVSSATNLITNANNWAQVYIYTEGLASLTVASVNADGEIGDASSSRPSISGDGRYVAFYSSASNLVDGVDDGRPYVYLHDTQTGTTVVASVDESGQPVASVGPQPGISDDGRFVTFTTTEPAVAGDTNLRSDVYLFDRETGAVRRMSFTYLKTEPTFSSEESVLSGDGSTVGFLSPAEGMVDGQTTSVNEGYVVDIP